MPKIVDHDQRRSELAHAALRVIGRDGMEAASTRIVAAESGWSTGVLKHYFRNKDELLRAALEELERSNLARLEDAGRATTGFEAIRAAVAAIMAADREDSAVWIAFTGRARTNQSTAQAWRRAMDRWSGRWAELVRRGQADGSISRGIDADRAGRELHALVNGLRIDALFRTGEPDPSALLLDALRAEPGH
jgi:AcrR family transcriptional regulator